MHPQITLSQESKPVDRLARKALIDWHLDYLSDITVKLPVEQNHIWQAKEQPLSVFYPQLRSQFADYARFMMEKPALQHSSLSALDVTFRLMAALLLKPALPEIEAATCFKGETQDVLREHIFKVLQMDDASFNNAILSFAHLANIATKPLALGTVFVPETYKQFSTAAPYENFMDYELDVKQSLHPYREMQVRFRMMIEYMQQHADELFASDTQATPQEKVALLTAFAQQSLTLAHQDMVDKGMGNHKDFKYTPFVHCQVLLSAVDMFMRNDKSASDLRILIESPFIVEHLYSSAFADASRSKTPQSYISGTEHQSVIAPVHPLELHYGGGGKLY